MQRRTLGRLAAATFALGLFAVVPAHAADEAPEVMIKRLSDETLGAIKADKSIAGDISKVIALVDSKIMPNVNFQRMTASAVGRYWRQATPEQQKRLQDEFKTLLVRTYSGALSQVKDQTVQLRPMRSNPDDQEVVVRTEIRGRGDPIASPAALASGFVSAVRRATVRSAASGSARGTEASMTPTALCAPPRESTRTGTETVRASGTGSPASVSTARSPCPTATR